MDYPTPTPMDESRSGDDFAEAPSSSSPSYSFFALKLSESAQKEARRPGNAQNVIAAILDKAIKGSGSSIDIDTLFLAELLDTLASLVARAVCMDPDYKPVDFAAWYKVRVPTGHASNNTAYSQDQRQCRQPCDLASELVRRLNGPGFPEVADAHTIRRAQPLAASAHALPHARPLAASAPALPHVRLFASAAASASPGAPQGYAQPASEGGIDAVYAWSQNCNGQNVGFFDVEQGWVLNTPDLPTTISPPPAPGINSSISFAQDDAPPQPHGTETLGVVLMTGGNDPDPAGNGAKGIAFGGTGHVFSAIFKAPPPTPGNLYLEQPWNGIAQAMPSMKQGDVLLVECQAANPSDGTYGFPAEIQGATYDTITSATAAGFIIVEPAGDAGASLDGLVDSCKRPIFRRGALDSGAIIVGAADTTKPNPEGLFPRLMGATTGGNKGSCYGARVDLFAWGNNVFTTAPAPEYFTTSDFNATSSAAAIIAGAAMVVQSMAAKMASNTGPFSRSLLRTYLAQGGTQSATPAVDLIGVMPNLRYIHDKVLNLSQMTTMRDRVGDDSSLPAAVTMQSPDIIVLHSAVYDPQSQFGSNSARNDSMLSQPVRPGQTNSIYVRLLNSGGAYATGVSVDVYWAFPSTVPTPDTWSPVGTATLSCVPNQNVLMVSDAIQWFASDVPEDGNVCLIAVLGSDQSPAPVFNLTPDCCSAADNNTAFLEHVSKNKDVAMCNVNQVFATLYGQHSLKFSIPCDWHRNQVHVIESLGNLPVNCEVSLRLPLMLARQLHLKLGEGYCDEEHAEVALPPHCQYPIGKGVLQANEAALCELRVRVPEGMHEQPGLYEFAVRQLCDGQEVGRVTWRFVQAQH